MYLPFVTLKHKLKLFTCSFCFCYFKHADTDNSTTQTLVLYSEISISRCSKRSLFCLKDSVEISTPFFAINILQYLSPEPNLNRQKRFLEDTRSQSSKIVHCRVRVVNDYASTKFSKISNFIVAH